MTAREYLIAALILAFGFAGLWLTLQHPMPATTEAQIMHQCRHFSLTPTVRRGPDGRIATIDCAPASPRP